MKTPQRYHQHQHQHQQVVRAEEGPRAHLLAGTPTRHDAADDDATVVTTKGCATFWVGEEWEVLQRVAVPVARLAHPRMLELLGEARDEYGFAHRGAVVVPCAVDRFMRAVEASASAAENRHRQRHGHGHHRHFLRLPHIHIARCFRPSHVVA